DRRRKHAACMWRGQMANPELSTREVIGPGATAGVIGGMVMGMLMMLTAVAHGAAPLTPMKMIAGVFWGARVMQVGGLATLVGLTIHLSSSAAFGIAFASLVPRETRARVATALGGLFGVAIFLLMTFVVLRFTNGFMHAHVSRGPFLVAHLVYG